MSVFLTVSHRRIKKGAWNPEYKEEITQIIWKIMCLFLWDRDREIQIDNSCIKKWEREREGLTGRSQSVSDIFCPVKKCPNSLFAASVPPLWATSKINGDHYRSHATWALLVQLRKSSLTPAPQTLWLFNEACASYGSKLSRLTPINRGQENTEGLRCRPGTDVASKFSLQLFVKLKGVCLLFEL